MIYCKCPQAFHCQILVANVLITVSVLFCLLPVTTVSVRQCETWGNKTNDIVASCGNWKSNYSLSDLLDAKQFGC